MCSAMCCNAYARASGSTSCVLEELQNVDVPLSEFKPTRCFFSQTHPEGDLMDTEENKPRSCRISRAKAGGRATEAGGIAKQAIAMRHREGGRAIEKEAGPLRRRQGH
ncbi:hypothetical protein EYF80_031571 [Liparis tanakae]|uniref:Uncharacterized protein n=1 Tax=Liparis tanakae TaxID=230148 RepID=A0A4Z2GY32_9TELE|nr:hypothetical protein EYF80_031571 [Liparis tanakae]